MFFDDSNLKGAFTQSVLRGVIHRRLGYRVANSLLSQELKLCFSDTKFTKAPYTKKILGFS